MATKTEELWEAGWMVQKTFAGYAAAHSHYVNATGGNVNSGYAVSHNHSIVEGPGWPAYEAVVIGGHGHNIAMAPEMDPAKAAPFIRHVLERMLDLLESEERWVKGQAQSWNHEAKVEQFCLIGALSRAQEELGLGFSNDAEVELNDTKKMVLRAVERFFAVAIHEDTGFSSMPEFNDNSQTTFEDVRLWLKGLFDRLGD